MMPTDGEVSFDVPLHGKFLSIHAHGSPLVLHVLDPHGRPVFGYDLRVTTPTGKGHWHYCWGLPQFSTKDAPARLLVGEGVTQLQVSMPGIGGALVRVAQGDPEKANMATIRLRAGDEVPWRRILRSLDGR
jgi:hypothetical protein